MGQSSHKPIIALAFSFLLPGLGQFYNHEMKKALVFFLFFIILSYIFAPLGILVMITAAVDSYRQARVLKKNGFFSKNFNIAIIILITILFGGLFVGFFASSLLGIINMK